jgi:hypothetical protein
MTPHEHLHFARALLDPAAPLPAGLRAWNGSDPAVRLDVYRNNVVASLVAALGETFPVVRELVGAAFFDAMAARFVRRHPPRSPVLAQYGEGFAAFVADFEPAASLPYLPDVARLEYARVQAHHAADAPVLDEAVVAAALADVEALPARRWALQPSLALVRSNHAVVSIWAAHQGVLDLADVDVARPETALVVRRDADVLVIGVDAGTAAFVDALRRQVTLGDALAHAAAEPLFDPASTLALLIGARAFATGPTLPAPWAAPCAR